VVYLFTIPQAAYFSNECGWYLGVNTPWKFVWDVCAVRRPCVYYRAVKLKTWRMGWGDVKPRKRQAMLELFDVGRKQRRACNFDGMKPT
jgi:hypothetical protein